MEKWHLSQVVCGRKGYLSHVIAGRKWHKRYVVQGRIWHLSHVVCWRKWQQKHVVYGKSGILVTWSVGEMDIYVMLSILWSVEESDIKLCGALKKVMKREWHLFYVVCGTKWHLSHVVCRRKWHLSHMLRGRIYEVKLTCKSYGLWVKVTYVCAATIWPVSWKKIAFLIRDKTIT